MKDDKQEAEIRKNSKELDKLWNELKIEMTDLQTWFKAELLEIKQSLKKEKKKHVGND